MRRLSWSLLLPVFLVLVQWGELRHEISHLELPADVCQKQSPITSDHCAICLAFAQLAGTAKPEVFAPLLLSSLAFSFAPETATAAVSLDALTPRSRGPPLS